MRGVAERFDALVIKRRPDQCWGWLGTKHRQGYAKISVNGRHRPAHRISYMLHKGPIPDGMLVCHKCDNPECTNPNHLFIGTALDNMQDKIKKGRHKGAKRGAKHHLAKLSSKQVEEIRILYKTDPISQQDIADSFGISQGQVSMIVNFKRWSN